MDNVIEKLQKLEEQLDNLENIIRSLHLSSQVQPLHQSLPPPQAPAQKEEQEIPLPAQGHTININVAPPSPTLTPTDTPESPKERPSLLSKIQPDKN